MSIDDVIRSWKDDSVKEEKVKKGEQNKLVPENPVGEQELSDDELEDVQGGVNDLLANSCNHDSC